MEANDRYSSKEPRRLSPPRKDPLLASKSLDTHLTRTFKDVITENEPVGSSNGIRKRRWDIQTPAESDTDFPVKKTPTSTRWDQQQKITPVSKWDKSPGEPERAINYGFDTPGGFFPTDITLISSEFKAQREIEARNAPFTDEALDSLIPSEGYEVLQPPIGYVPLITPSRKLTSTPNVNATLSSHLNAPPVHAESLSVADDLPLLKYEDLQYFGPLLDKVDEAELSLDDMKKRKVLKLLLKLKNGTPPMRRQAMRTLVEKAIEIGAGTLFDAILPIMLSPNLDDQERHMFVKLIDRLLFKLDYLVRPYVHNILVVIEPLLIDEDFLVRTEGREVLSNLSKAAGLATMIFAMRPDIENHDEYVRNITARAFAVVATSLGVDSVIPFISAACKSRKSWFARHSGLKIIQQIAILSGCTLLPYLNDLWKCVEAGLLDDEQPKVRTMAALSLSALAESSYPFGREIFRHSMDVLWGIMKNQKGKGLAACLRAFGNISIVLDIESCNYYVSNLADLIIREFESTDDDLKRVLLSVLRQLASINAMSKDFWETRILGPFMKWFWTRKVSQDRRSYRPLLQATTAIAKIVGQKVVLEGLVRSLKDECEQLRKASSDAVRSILKIPNGSVVDLDNTCDILIDALTFAFQEQTESDMTIADTLSLYLNILGKRCSHVHPQIVSMILWRLSNRSTIVRQLAAELAGMVSEALTNAESEALVVKMGTILYENLGEEYPDVLGSILKGLYLVGTSLGLSRMSPSPREILPRLTPILRNRHERVQENCVDMIGLIAERCPDAVNAKEWMRICFELLDLLKAPRKSIRRSAVLTFGKIAKAIGPSDVLIALLNNLKVQERQNRVCTTIAIAIVADSCGPFTVIPSLMNEYRIPELNIQNGVLKALSFLFEYIGESSKDYIFALCTLLEDALTDRDLVHRQTACSVIRNAAIGAAGYGCEEALMHFLNHVIPNIFETSPHVIFSVIETLEALRVSVGSGILLNYAIQGLFHPARRVREVYWRVYNNLYISNPESLIPQYPSVMSDKGMSNCHSLLSVTL